MISKATTNSVGATMLVHLRVVMFTPIAPRLTLATRHRRYNCRTDTPEQANGRYFSCSSAPSGVPAGYRQQTRIDVSLRGRVLSIAGYKARSAAVTLQGGRQRGNRKARSEKCRV